MASNPASAPDRLLLVVAAKAEAGAILRGFGAENLAIEPWKPASIAASVDLLLTGVGKANAAGALARCLDPRRHRAIVNLGVAGALPAQPSASAADLLDAVLATRSVFADEGLATPAGFESLAAMGFPLMEGDVGASADLTAMAMAPAPALFEALAPLADHAGPIATVSTCSGADAAAREIAQRTGALAEAMEGAALALALRRLVAAGFAPAALRFAELRVISNTTGDRAGQRWRLAEALDRLATLAPHVRERALALRPPD